MGTFTADNGRSAKNQLDVSTVFQLNRAQQRASTDIQKPATARFVNHDFLIENWLFHNKKNTD
jgi:hypothetical protein